MDAAAHRRPRESNAQIGHGHRRNSLLSVGDDIIALSPCPTLRTAPAASAASDRVTMQPVCVYLCPSPLFLFILSDKNDDNDKGVYVCSYFTNHHHFQITQLHKRIIVYTHNSYCSCAHCSESHTRQQATDRCKSNLARTRMAPPPPSNRQ